MDKSWMQKSRLSQEYREGVEQFLNFAFENASEDNMILCPCLRCGNISWHMREIIFEHLICIGFLSGYINWYFHGEPTPSVSSSRVPQIVTPQIQHDLPIRQDDMEGMLRDAFNIYEQNFQNSSPQSDFGEMNDFGEHGRGLGDQEPKGEASKFYKLLEDMNEELYEGSKHSRLSFCVRLFHLKCLCGWTGNSLTLLLEFMKEMFPFAKIPESCKASKKMIKDLGLGYEKIHSCPNDCMLYWGDRKNQQSCYVCGNSRWLDTSPGDNLNVDDSEVNVSKKPAKVLRYFPLIPRLQRLFMSSKTSDFMRWHHDGRTDDGLLRHPANREGSLLAGFLGMVARNGTKVSLHYETWHKVPDGVKKDALNFVEQRFFLQGCKKYALESLGKKWRDYKCYLKSKYFNRNTDPNVTMQIVPPGVIRWQYEALVAFWYSEKGEEKLRGAKIGRVELFQITHTKKDGSYLNETSRRIVEAAKEKMVEFEASSDASVSKEDLEDQAFIEVVGKERSGRVRGLGTGPTPSSYYGCNARQFSQSNTQQEVCTLREKLQTMETRFKELENERKNERAQFQQMQEQLNHMMNLMQQQIPGNNVNFGF